MEKTMRKIVLQRSEVYFPKYKALRKQRNNKNQGYKRKIIVQPIKTSTVKDRYKSK